MTFLSALWLWLPLFFVLYALYRRKSGAGMAWSLKSAALAAAALFAVIALSRPALPQAPVDIERRGSDVIFAIDISRSMQAADIAPSRLEAAKRLLRETVETDTEDRFGVVAFTTNPIILSPLTRDEELLLHLFSGLDTSLVVTKGTDIGSALKLARRMSRSARPLVVILTDGGDELGYAQEAAWAKAQGLVVDVVLLATDAGSTLAGTDGQLLKDEQGGIVVTSANTAISEIADATGGAVIKTADAAALIDLLADQRSEEALSKTKVVNYRELFMYPLALSLFLSMFGMTDLLARLRGKRDD